MPLETLLTHLKTDPATVEFAQVIAAIDAYYDYQDCAFSNGLGASAVINDLGSNIGSCKIFAFAQLNGLSEAQTLACFGDYYRGDVLLNPDGNDHQNIRNFMKTGWLGIHFSGQALRVK